MNHSTQIVSRRQNEQIDIGGGIILTIVKVNGEKVRVGIQAPEHLKVLRGELSRIAEIEEPASAADADRGGRSEPPAAADDQTPHTLPMIPRAGQRHRRSSDIASFRRAA